MFNFLRRLCLGATATAVTLSLGGCVANPVQHGNLLAQDKLELLIPGATTRAEVVALVGPPSSKGIFDGANWYYIGQRGNQYAFFKPDIEQDQVVRLTFTKDDVLEKIKIYDADGKEILTPHQRTTVSAGHDQTILEKVFSGFGRRYQREK